MDGGGKRAREAMALKELADEEQLEEDELRQQLDNANFYKFMNGKRKMDIDKELQNKEQKQVDEIDQLLKAQSQQIG